MTWSPGLEKLNYSLFMRRNMAYKTGMIPNTQTTLSEMELPTNSVVHLATNFGNPDAISIDPDLSIPYIKAERHPIYLSQIYTLPTEGPFAVTDKVRYRPNAYTPKHMAFFRKTSAVRRALSLDAILKRQAILLILDYNTVLTAKAPGRYSTYLQFKVLLQTMLDQVSQIDDRHQFFHFPLSSEMYTRTDFLRAFEKIDGSSLAYPDDMSYFIVLHLLGLLARGLHPEPNDPVSTSLFGHLEFETLKTLNIIFSMNDSAIVYNLGDLMEMASTDTFYLRVLRHINTTTLIGLGENVDDAKNLSDDAFFDRLEKDKSSSNTNTPEEKPKEDPETDSTPNVPDPPTSDRSLEPSAPDRSPEVNQATPEAYTDYLSQRFHQQVTENPNMSAKQKQKAEILFNKSKGITLNGETLENLINKNDPDIHDNDLDFLQDDLPDKSMTKSSIADFDQLYVNEVMDKDIASVLVSMSEHGFYITDLQVEDDVTSLNHIRHYKAVYNDVEGKKHVVQFKLPIVQNDGTFMINGVQNRMTKQQVNLPIVKVSPTRVNISSNYNKAIVEKKMNQASRIDIYYHKALQSLRKDGYATVSYGKTEPTPDMPYDYAQVGSKYQTTHIKTDDGPYTFHFDYANRFTSTYGTLTESQIEQLKLLEQTHGVYCGRGPQDAFLFYHQDNFIRHIPPNALTQDKPSPTETETYTDVLHRVKEAKVLNIHPEWVEVKIQDRTFPIIFLFGYQYGLSETLKKMDVPYRFYPHEEERPRLKPTDIKVPFADGDLVVPRYPLRISLIVAGLRRFKTKSYMFADLDLEDAYFNMLLDLQFSTNYLKGITNFFDFFVDPITRSVLQSMGEPTDVYGILRRSTDLLTTPYADEASSMANHRVRSYERFPDFLYNEMSRAAASYSTSGSQKKKFSINPDSVFLKIIQDSTVSPVEIVNPVSDMKNTTAITYTGSVGGRTSQSFVINDRRYPEDGVGILSESTPDSGKVAINAHTSANPAIRNIRGEYQTTNDPESMAATQILSGPALLLPGSTQDDSKRTNFISIQLGHHVPCANGDVARIRTGYEKVLAHRVSDDFAYSAKRDGTIQTIDQKAQQVIVAYDDVPVVPDAKLTLSEIKKSDLKSHAISQNSIYIVKSQKEAGAFSKGRKLYLNDTTLVEVKETVLVQKISDLSSTRKYITSAQQEKLKKESPLLYIRLDPISPTAPGERDVIDFGNKYTPVSGSHLEQPIKITVQEGDRIQRGDILAYNAGFFQLDPVGRSVSWKHGVMATVAMVDTAITYEDSCAISQGLGERLTMSPAHVRTLTIKNDTVLHEIVSVGDQVETTDLLATLEDGDLDATSISDDPETVAFLAELNRKAPRAKYAGDIVEIKMYYGTDRENLHLSLQNLAKRLDALLERRAQNAKGTIREKEIPWPQKIPAGTKYQGIDFDETTVIIEITIRDSLACGTGDKIVLGAQAKSVIGEVFDRDISTKSGLPVDMLFSTSSISNRIILSPLIMGIGERCLETLEQHAIDIYFGESS